MADTKFNNGGAAFPNLIQNSEYAENGMSLRDYFAAKVLQGMFSRDCYDEGQATPQQRARLAYIDADAMLAERDRR